MQAFRIAMVLAALVSAAPIASAQQAPDLSIYYGTERATLGARFGKLVLGAVDATLLLAQPGVQVLLVKAGRRLDGIEVGVPASSCTDLANKLAQLWGPPKDGEWYSRSGTQGARFRGNDDFDIPCWLSFYRRVSPQQLLTSSRQ